jgi:hypothetical protein
MRTYHFYQKHGGHGVTVTLSAESFEQAEEVLMETVQGDCGWRCDNDEGEDEDE